MNIFFNLRNLEFKINPQPLQILKIIILGTVFAQCIYLLLDSPLIFSDHGLFPWALAKEYAPNHFYAPLLKDGDLLCWLTLVFVGLAAWKPTQAIGFLGIFCGEFLIGRRAFVFLNAGDYALFFFSLMLALTPRQHLYRREADLSVFDILPLSILNLIIYVTNFIGKLKSAWGEGTGLDMSLAHVDMLRIPVIHLPTWLSLSLNYSAIFCVLILAVGSILNPQFRRWRNGILAIGIAYHLFANIIFKLDWFSFPFMGLMIGLLINPVEKDSPASSTKSFSKIKTYAALTVLFLAFFNRTSPDDFAFFSDRGFPMGHTWFMFAPPAQSNTAWKAILEFPKEHQEIISLEEIPPVSNFALFQHRYKYLHNLRRPELIPLTKEFSLRLCERFKPNQPELQKISLIRETTSLQRQETYKVLYPAEICN